MPSRHLIMGGFPAFPHKLDVSQHRKPITLWRGVITSAKGQMKSQRLAQSLLTCVFGFSLSSQPCQPGCDSQQERTYLSCKLRLRNLNFQDSNPEAGMYPPSGSYVKILELKFHTQCSSPRMVPMTRPAHPPSLRHPNDT